VANHTTHSRVHGCADITRSVKRGEARSLRVLRKVLKTRGHMPNDQAALKLLYLAVRNAQKNWGGRDRRWNTALLQFAIHFEGRIPE
jgi:transposase-like protein